MVKWNKKPIVSETPLLSIYEEQYKAVLTIIKGVSKPDGYFHYTGKSAEEPLLLDHGEYKQFVWYKPNGLWVSIGNVWGIYTAYVGRQGYYKYSIEFDTSNILKISNVDEFNNFNKSYIAPNGLINWYGVAKTYDGILIDLYPLLDIVPCPKWIKTWDFPSGCLWNTRIITKITEIDPDVD